MTKSQYANPTAGFRFGKNWESFVKNYFSEERVEISRQHILEFLGVANLNGLCFLDVGCGSGLSSLAALRAGANRIISFDVDPDSAKTTERLHALSGAPDHWQVLQGSVLDMEFLAKLDPADVLYSWGVLHHTGAMWKAIENVLPLVKPNGAFYVALYTTSPASAFWIRTKQEYNRASFIKKRLMELWYVQSRVILPQLRARQNPFGYMLNYKRSRGMEFMTDIRDWLGGWPYEDATVEAVLAFFATHGFRAIRVRTGEANTEYLFVRQELQSWP